MNRIYKIIWSKAKNCWIVVSEIAKRCGKAGSQPWRSSCAGSVLCSRRSFAARAACSLLLAAVLAVTCGQQAAWANGENMINAGITFALDKGKGFGTSKAAMARKINDLTAENAAQGQQIAVQNEKIAAQDVEIQILKEALARLEAKVNNK